MTSNWPPTEELIRATLHQRRDGRAIKGGIDDPVADYCSQQGYFEDYYRNGNYKWKGIQHQRLTLLGWETLQRLNVKYGHDIQYTP
jgi:hypothetical protein